MKDTNDMMEDAVSEDTMMDCGSEDDTGSLDDLVYLATDIADSAPTVRDAAERLLTLLGVDEDDEDINDDVSSSEDEGVEVDANESDVEEESQENSRILRLLAASLAQELKYTKQGGVNSKILQVQVTSQAHELPRNTLQSMDVAQDVMGIDKDRRLRDREDFETKYMDAREEHCELGFRQYNKRFDVASRRQFDAFSKVTTCIDSRFGMDDLEVPSEEGLSSSWGAGWDACASEALRYLVEDEGLPPLHPTVVAMKDHLELQRERSLMQYTA